MQKLYYCLFCWPVPYPDSLIPGTWIQQSLRIRIQQSPRTRIQQSLRTRIQQSLRTRIQQSLRTRIQQSLRTRTRSFIPSATPSPPINLPPTLPPPPKNYYEMHDWLCFSSSDRLHWTEHPVPLSVKDFAWAKPTHGPHSSSGGAALITNNMTTETGISWDDIDPTVFIDDNGQAYLFWGNTVLPSGWHQEARRQDERRCAARSLQWERPRTSDYRNA